MCLWCLHLRVEILTELECNRQLTIIPSRPVNLKKPTSSSSFSHQNRQSVFVLKVTGGALSPLIFHKLQKFPEFSRESGKDYLEKASSSPSSTSCQEINNIFQYVHDVLLWCLSQTAVCNWLHYSREEEMMYKLKTSSLSNTNMFLMYC